MPDTYRCTNVIFGFDDEMTFITLNCDLEIQQGAAWLKVKQIVAEFPIAGLDEFREAVISHVRAEARQNHLRRTILANAEAQLEAALFTVD